MPWGDQSYDMHMSSEDRGGGGQLLLLHAYALWGPGASDGVCIAGGGGHELATVLGVQGCNHVLCAWLHVHIVCVPCLCCES